MIERNLAAENAAPKCTCPVSEVWDADWDGEIRKDPGCPWHGENKGRGLPSMFDPDPAVIRRARIEGLKEALAIAYECAELWEELPRDSQVANDVAASIRERIEELERE